MYIIPFCTVYIPLPSLHNHDLKLPNFMFCVGCKHKFDKINGMTWDILRAMNLQTVRIHF